MPKRIGMGLVGPGFVGAHHIDAVRRLGFVDVVAVAASSEASARTEGRCARRAARPTAASTALIADPDVHVVHNTTPNHLHGPVIAGGAGARQARHLRQAAGDDRRPKRCDCVQRRRPTPASSTP